MPGFAELARDPDPPLDALALAMAAEVREVDAAAALATLDDLGAELAHAVADVAVAAKAQADACARLLGGVHAFTGDRADYDHPDNSMLDLVLARRRGLPILLSILYVEVGRRAGVPLAGVGLRGHFVVGHFGATPPVLLDPFSGGRAIDDVVQHALVRPWRAHEIAMRMLNNLVGAYGRRGQLGAALSAAQLRLALPADKGLRDSLRADVRALQARLN
jgi:regulator of sirC expression with transglutaminase-like and TPR domain